MCGKAFLGNIQPKKGVYDKSNCVIKNYA